MTYMKFTRLILKAELFNGDEIGTDIQFDDGCTVIVTDSNTQGKSSLINSLAVGLGFDDLVKSNISALVNDMIKHNGKEHRILSANIFLEIKNQNDDFLSIKRAVQPELSKGLLVTHGVLSEWNDDKAEECYVGKDSYIGTRGFHRLLSEFIRFPEIEVISQNDGIMKLYMEYIFAAIFIEQKRGWADIMANTPYYQVRDPKKSTVSEILGMTYIQDNLLRNALKLDVSRLRSNYEDKHEILRNYVNGRHFSLKGIPSDLNSVTWNPSLYRSFEGKDATSLQNLVTQKQKALSDLGDIPAEDHDASELKTRLVEISDKITVLVAKKREIDSSLSVLDSAITKYKKRMQVLDDDLQKNKEDQKIRKLFDRDSWSIKAQCPVCEQSIDESLLSQVKSFPTMSLDENVKYIIDQKDILRDVLVIEEEQKKNYEFESNYLSSEITLLMKQNSEIQKSLSGTIPSELMAKAREIAQLEQEINALYELAEDSQSMFEKLKKVFDDYHIKNNKLKALNSDLSENDKEIIQKFQKTFKDYLRRLGYNSYEINSMVIDQTTFSPRVIINSLEQKKKTRADFGSSASDWIRIITSYTLALHACRNNSLKSVHPNVTVFDEPAQQNMDREDHLKFYDIVHDVCKQGGQVIIAETDKDHSVKQKALSLGMKVIDFKSRYILSE